MQQIVHLKLSSEYPPEVLAAAVLRQDNGEWSVLMKVRVGGQVVDRDVPLADSDRPPESVLADAGVEVGDNAVAYRRLLTALHQLTGSSE